MATRLPPLAPVLLLALSLTFTLLPLARSESYTSPPFLFSEYLLANCPAPMSARDGVKRRDFGDGFVFGVSTSATQIEGGVLAGGRGPSIWDAYALKPGRVKDGSMPAITLDSFSNYKRDVALMKEMGVQSYRFSISWSRILPRGQGDVNEEGVRYYRDLINELLDNGIEPVVTLYHWDLPQALEREEGGWLNASIAQHFTNYAETCFRKFGKQVRTWVTFSEPQQIAVQGYGTGTMAPGRCSDRTVCAAGDSTVEPYLVGHNILRAHALAVQFYRQKYQKQQGGKIGIALDCTYHYAADDSRAAKNAAQRGMEFAYAWFADPIRFGSYPKSMRYFVADRMPSFTPKEARRMRGSTDFLGLDFYSAVYAWPGNNVGPGIPWTDARVSTSPKNPKTGEMIGQPSSSSWLYVAPGAMRDMLLWLKNRYGSKVPILVTENGVSEANYPKLALSKALCDEQRVGFHSSYLSSVLDAKNAGANVQGYFAWTLMDNWEWTQGFTQRFGMVYVNFSNPARPRYPKASAIWYKNFLHRWD